LSRASRSRQLAAALWLLVAPAGAVAGGQLQGWVVAPATGARIAGLPLSLSAPGPDSVQWVATATTDGQGAFRFRDERLADSLQVVLTAEYQGVPHTSSPLRVGDQQQVIFEVFPPTQSDPGIRLAGMSAFIQATADGLQVVEWLQVDNPGAAAFVGGGRGVVTELALPAGAQAVRSLGAPLVTEASGRIGDARPLLPGITEIAFAYTVPAVDGRVEWSVERPYRCAQVDIFVQPAGYHAPPDFADLGPVEVQGNRYRRLRHAALAPGARLTLAFGGGEGQLDGWPWVALGVAVGLGVLVAVLGRRQPRPGQPGGRGLGSRGALVAQIARLDELYRDDESNPEYRQRRAELVRRAVAVPTTPEAERERK
jgi:hypothetical protein